MKKIWTAENLATDWLILPEDQQLIEHKRGATRLGFALLLKFFQLEGRFPLNPHEVPQDAGALSDRGIAAVKKRKSS